MELDSEAPLARAGRPTTTAATEAGLRGFGTGLAKMRHIGMRLRRVGAGVNQYVAANIGCGALRKWIQEKEEVKRQ